MTRHFLTILALALAGTLGACSQKDATVEDYESETHFLSLCDGSCPGDLDCLCGVCTTACEADAMCSGLATGAQCLAIATCGDAVCDVECAKDSDCGSISSGASCEAGRCRSAAAVQPSADDDSSQDADDDQTNQSVDDDGSDDDEVDDDEVDDDAGDDDGAADDAATADDDLPDDDATTDDDAVADDDAVTDDDVTGDDDTVADDDAGVSTECAAELPAGCDCYSDSHCGDGQRCYYADCAMGEPGGCNEPPLAGGCWDQRDCPEGTVCQDGEFPICGRDTLTSLGHCAVEECGNLGRGCEDGELCILIDRQSGAELEYQCVPNTCRGSGLDCDCGADICEATPATPACSLPGGAQRTSDLVCLPGSSNMCVEETQTGCSGVLGTEATACCDGLVCCEGVPYDQDGECLTECLLLSDRTLKTEIRDVDTATVLERVAEIPISHWVYRHDPETQHLGPMAQDFSRAFGLGKSDRVIEAVDALGVAFSAIQALNHRVDLLAAENAELAARLAARPACDGEK